MRTGKKDEAEAIKANTGKWKEEGKQLGEQLPRLKKNCRKTGFITQPAAFISTKRH
jgi:hypothetical protein